MSTRTAALSLLTALALSLMGPAITTASAQPEQVCFDALLAGGTTQVCADVHENPLAPFGTTVLAVHGFTETAQVWNRLAEAIFDDVVLRFTVKRVIALDLPGHGASEPPVGLPDALFGELTLHHNVSVVIQAIDSLRAQGLGPRVIMGHSMGGLTIAGVQEALLASGSSLAAHGVNRAIMLAPVPVLDVTWNAPPPSDLSAFVVIDPSLGAYLALPPQLSLLGGGYTNTMGELVSGTPSVEEAAAYVGFEPITTALQLTGQIEGLPRLSARQGAFAPIRGTLLSVVGFGDDVLTPADDLDELYEHLIGRRGLLYRRIDGAEAVHNMFISDAEAVVPSIRALLLVP